MRSWLRTFLRFIVVIRRLIDSSERIATALERQVELQQLMLLDGAVNRVEKQAMGLRTFGGNVGDPEDAGPIFQTDADFVRYEEEEEARVKAGHAPGLDEDLDGVQSGDPG